MGLVKEQKVSVYQYPVRSLLVDILEIDKKDNVKVTVEILGDQFFLILTETLPGA